MDRVATGNRPASAIHHFCCFYRASDADVADFASQLEASVHLVDLARSQLLLVGDFNARSPLWNSSDVYNQAGRILEPAFSRLGLHQCVDSPTHLQVDGSLGSLLDLVLTSTRHAVVHVDTQPPLGSSDHLSVLSILDTAPACTLRVVPRRIWNFEKADFVAVNKALSTADWSGITSAACMDDAWSCWLSTFLAVVNKSVPSKTVRTIKPKNPFLTPVI